MLTDSRTSWRQTAAFFILKIGNRMWSMKNVLCLVLVVVTCLGLLAAAPEEKAPKPQYDQKGQLIRPADYREWMFLSAGYGVNYWPRARQSRDVYQRLR